MSGPGGRGQVSCATESPAVVARPPAPKIEEAAGKHVFREKPIMQDLGRTQQAIDAIWQSPRSRGWTAPETFTRGGAHG